MKTLRKLLLLACGLLFSLPSAQAYWEDVYKTSARYADSINAMGLVGDTLWIYVYDYISFSPDRDLYQVCYGKGPMYAHELTYSFESYSYTHDTWMLEPVGRKCDVTRKPLFYIRNIETGYYVAGENTLWPDKTEAWDFCVYKDSAKDSLWSGLKKKDSIDYTIAHHQAEGDSMRTYYLGGEPYACFRCVTDKTPLPYKKLQTYIDSLQANYLTPEKYCVVGTGLGKVSREEANALNATYQRARNASATLPAAQYTALETELRRGYDRIDSLVALIPDGYYKVLATRLDTTGNKTYPSAMRSAGNGQLYTSPLYNGGSSAPEAQTVFRLTRNADGGYWVQSIYDSTYISAYEEKYSSYYVKMSAAQEWPLMLQGNRCGTLSFYSSKPSPVRYYYIPNGNVQAWSMTSGRKFFWTLEPVEGEARIDSLRKEAQQSWAARKIDTLLQKGMSRLAEAEFYNADRNHPVVTDAAQLSCNNLSTDLYDLRMLLDNNLNSYIQTTSTALRAIDSLNVRDALPEHHYLQAHAATPIPARLALRMGAGTGAFAPTKVEIKASRDGENWTVADTISNPWALLPTTRAADYISPKPILLDAADYTYLRLTVLETNSKSKSAAGFPFFQLSEFNIYPMSDVDPRSQILRPEVRRAADTLCAVIKEMQAMQESDYTLSHYHRLLDADNAFLSVWSDTTQLTESLANAHEYMSSCREGDTIGQFKAGALSYLAGAIKSTETLRPFFRLTRAGTDSASTALNGMLEEFASLMIQPDPDEWYLLTGNAANTSGTVQLGYGQCLRTNGNDAGSTLRWGGSVRENEQNAQAAWRFVPLDERKKTFAIQNLASAWYIGEMGNNHTYMSATPKPYKLVPLPGGKVALREAEGRKALMPYDAYSIRPTVPTLAYGYRAAWSFNYADDLRMTDIRSFRPGAYYIITLPYGHRYLPQAKEATMTWYRVCGSVWEGDECTGLKLKELDYIPEAGHPYVLHVGNSSASTVYSDMAVELWDSKPDTTAYADNGLHGALRSLTLTGGGYAIQEGTDDRYGYKWEFLKTENGFNFNVEAQTGYVVLSEVTDTGEEPDAVMKFDNNGKLNTISTATASAPQEAVSVFTLDGVRLRTGVARGRATQGLPRGIYLVGRSKVVVR